jgi:hypothetical protein
MNASLKKTWETQKKLLQDNIKEEINFFKKPVSLETIINSGLVLLSQISSLYLTTLESKLNKEVTHLSVDDYIKNSEQSKLLIKIASTSQNEELLSLLNACNTDVPSDDVLVNSMTSNFNSDAINSKLENLDKIKDDVEFLIFCLYFINWIIFMIIDLIKNSEIPSLFRAKYLQNLIHTLSVFTKERLKKIGVELKEISSIIKSLATIDALLISIVTASYYYISNRKKFQKNSLDSVNTVLFESSCKPTIIDPIDIVIDASILNFINVDDIDVCDMIEDESPTLPIINEEISCEVNSVVQEEINPTFIPDLITNAYIENITQKNLLPLVSNKSYITTSTIIGTLDSSVVYSPVQGYVNKLSPTRIYITDIKENEESELEKITSTFADNYKKLFEITEFIKKYSIQLIYPIMLANPGKLKTNTGTRVLYNQIIKQSESKLNDYNNVIQDITKYDNIKSFLEDNKVDEIKLKIDKETNNLLNEIKTTYNNAIDSQYNTIPIPTDYVLYDYYILLLTQLNTSPSLTEIENTLVEKLKEYTQVKFTTISNDELKIESQWIKAFLESQWSQYEKINEDNVKIQSYLLQSNMISGYTVKEENGVKYKVYTITDNTNCDKNIDSIIKPDSSKDLYTKKYWLKYLSYVTLVGATDLLSWSTGLILPTGPVKLPVIYTPIIPIKTAYGFILIGLTICGIYVSPFITYNNMTLSPKSIVNPNIVSINDELKSIKDEINTIGASLKNDLIKPILQNIKDELSPVKQQIIDIKNIIKIHNANKPVNGVKHEKELANWNIQSIFNNKKYASLSTEKFKLQIKYKILNDYLTTGKLNSSDNDKSIKKVNSTINTMNSKVDKLNSILDKIDDIISALPTALAPNSINFGATLKNPKLVIEIDTDTNANINNNILDQIFISHKKTNETFMNKNFVETPNSNLKNYYDIIKSSMNIIVDKEPYPTYDRISPTNLGFLKFAKTFAKKGAKTFGIPGQLPFP